MSAADVGDPAADGEPVGHPGQGWDPLSGEAGGVAGAEEPLGALEDSRVLLVPGDARAGAERSGETVDAREPAAGDGGAAGQEDRRRLNVDGSGLPQTLGRGWPAWLSRT